ncbi:MAG: PQQ-binding-like beta-propeller repeat protein [Thermomicrobiales bacterium]
MYVTPAAAPAPVPARTVQLFSGKAVILLTLLFGFPTGLLLLAHNWRRLGQRARMVGCIVAALLGMIALIAVAAEFVGTTGLWLLALLQFVMFFIIVKLAEDVDKTASRDELLLIDRNAWRGVGVGVALALVVLLTRTLLLAMQARESRIVAFGERDGRVSWVTALGGARSANPLAVTAAGGRTFAYTLGDERSGGGSPKELIALDGATGRQLWRFSPDRRAFDNISSYEVVFLERKLFADADTVYVQVVEDFQYLDLLALDARSGTLLWTASLGDLDSGIPQYRRVVRQGDELIILHPLSNWDRTTRVTTKTIALEALDRHTGAVSWRVELPDFDPQWGVTDPFGDDGVIVVDLGKDRLAGFAPGTGARLWTRDIALQPLALIGANLYGRIALSSGTAEQELVALDPATGEQRWSYRYVDRDQNFPAFDRDGAYLMMHDRDADENCIDQFVALGATDGRERWRITASVVDLYPPVRGDSLLVANIRPSGCAIGNQRFYAMVAYAPDAGSEQWRLPGEYHGYLTLEGGRIFVEDSGPRWRNWLARLNPAWR